VFSGTDLAKNIRASPGVVSPVRDVSPAIEGLFTSADAQVWRLVPSEPGL